MSIFFSVAFWGRGRRIASVSAEPFSGDEQFTRVANLSIVTTGIFVFPKGVVGADRFFL